MDKTVIFAVAGAGKTTYIVNSLSRDKRSLIVTYTDANYYNLRRKITDKFNGDCPENISLMTYFKFLFRFCYKPFLADVIRARKITFEKNQNKVLKQDDLRYFRSDSGYLYSNRLSLLIEKYNATILVRQRLEKYFDEFIIDEIQDIAGRDFNFLENLMSANVNMLFVGDFYQHTFDTSRDGNVNKKLFNDYTTYASRFEEKGFYIDKKTLINSWRCEPDVCKFITSKLGISILSNKVRDHTSNCKSIIIPSGRSVIEKILSDATIVKLHYENSDKYGVGHRNWGDVKGEDGYQDVCVLLNQCAVKKYCEGNLNDLNPLTRNKLYVAITRAHRRVYLINENDINDHNESLFSDLTLCHI